MISDTVFSLVIVGIAMVLWICIDFDQKRYEEQKGKTVLYGREYVTDKWYKS